MGENSKRTKGPGENEDVKKYLDNIERRITHELPSKLLSLQRLREMMTSSECAYCFDKEDLSWVDNDIGALSKELHALRKEFEEKSQLYNRTLVDMQKTLDMRVEILNKVDEETNLCNLRPTLVKLFAEKQCELIKSMEECRKKVYDHKQQ
jgi:hypothetical protein